MSLIGTILEDEDNYFMGLENCTLTTVDPAVAERAMYMKIYRSTNLEWMQGIEDNLDYTNETDKQNKVALYKRWVRSGNGNEWFQ